MTILEQCIRLAIKELHFSESPSAEPIISYVKTECSMIPAERRESLIESARDAERQQRMRIKQREVIRDKDSRRSA